MSSGKYGPEGAYRPENLDEDIPADLASIICNSANFSLSKSSWSSYSTALNMTKKCSEETGTNLSFPFTETKSLIFTGWLIKKGLAATTVDKYLSGIRAMHLAAGHTNFNIRNDLVKAVITGRKNQNNIEESIGEKKERIPVTPKLMLLIKKELGENTTIKPNPLLLWSVSSLLFSGGFRIGELLAPNKTTFDPYCTLLGRDIKLKQEKYGSSTIETVQITLKTEKTNKSSKHTIIDVYASEGHLCPVKAFKRWSRHNPCDPDLPAFRDDDGSPLTQKEFNSFLADFSRKYLDTGKRTLSSHSFRAGMCTLLATLGYSDEEIMSWGRWNSRAFETYIKAPRSKRLWMAKQIAKLN